MEVDPDVWRRMRGKLELPARNNQSHHFPMRPQILHDKRQRETMMTREDESMSLKHQFHRLLKRSSDIETRVI